MQFHDKNGWYFTINLKNPNKTKRIHVLVAEAFIGDIPKGYHVHHKDGNKQNNIVTNLEILHPSDHSHETVINDVSRSLIKNMVYKNKYINPKPVCMFDTEDNYMATFPNAAAAEVVTGICSRNILQVANRTPYGKHNLTRHQAGGYVWKFKDDCEVITKCS